MARQHQGRHGHGQLLRRGRHHHALRRLQAPRASAAATTPSTPTSSTASSRPSGSTSPTGPWRSRSTDGACGHHAAAHGQEDAGGPPGLGLVRVAAAARAGPGPRARHRCRLADHRRRLCRADGGAPPGGALPRRAHRRDRRPTGRLRRRRAQQRLHDRPAPRSAERSLRRRCGGRSEADRHEPSGDRLRARRGRGLRPHGLFQGLRQASRRRRRARRQGARGLRDAPRPTGRALRQARCRGYEEVDRQRLLYPRRVYARGRDDPAGRLHPRPRRGPAQPGRDLRDEPGRAPRRRAAPQGPHARKAGSAARTSSWL